MEIWAIALGVVGVAATLLFVFGERTGMLKKRWALGTIGIISVLLFAIAAGLVWHQWYSILVIGVLAVIGILGVLSVVFEKVRNLLKAIRPHITFGSELENQKKLKNISTIEEPKKIAEPSGEILSEHIIKNVQSVAEQLKKVIAGANTCSLKAISGSIFADSVFSTWYKSRPLIIQLMDLFTWQLDQLFNRSTKYEEKTRIFGGSDVSQIYNETWILILNYRSAISNFIHLLNNLEKEGAPAIWKNDPFSSKIHCELRDNYDELMQRIKNLKVYVADEVKSVLPSDDQLTKFDRVLGIIK